MAYGQVSPIFDKVVCSPHRSGGVLVSYFYFFPENRACCAFYLNIPFH